MKEVVTVIEVETLEELDILNTEYEEHCNRCKDIAQDKFEYDINIDYDKLELIVTMKIEEADDNSETNPSLN